MFVQPTAGAEVAGEESHRTGTDYGDDGFNERVSVEDADELPYGMTRGSRKPREGQSSATSDDNYSNTMKSTKFYNKSLYQ